MQKKDGVGPVGEGQSDGKRRIEVMVKMQKKLGVGPGRMRGWSGWW